MLLQIKGFVFPVFQKYLNYIHQGAHRRKHCSLGFLENGLKSHAGQLAKRIFKGTLLMPRLQFTVLPGAVVLNSSTVLYRHCEMFRTT
ncbi:hypothetical protein chiPu_0008840 [Chiloscyllium punctatum]|uniref:Uncharacterized protein n=1 Tax=Chiloscyllium punctatum TaxID=137246 RepID=A0A401SIZ7_CHIPU|nr:hypothetical protein [Chiloscyllium punctatum]